LKKDKYRKVLIFLSLNDLKLLIWPIYDLKNWLWHSKTSKSHICHHFYGVIKITSPKIRHQNHIVIKIGLSHHFSSI